MKNFFTRSQIKSHVFTTLFLQVAATKVIYFEKRAKKGKKFEREQSEQGKGGKIKQNKIDSLRSPVYLPKAKERPCGRCEGRADRHSSTMTGSDHNLFSWITARLIDSRATPRRSLVVHLEKILVMVTIARKPMRT